VSISIVYARTQLVLARERLKTSESEKEVESIRRLITFYQRCVTRSYIAHRVQV